MLNCFNSRLLGATTVIIEWALETCMSQCAIPARRFLNPFVASQRILLQKWLMCYFSCLVMQLPWASGHRPKARRPADGHTRPTSVEGPREPWALFLAFIKMSWSCHLCPFSGNSDVGNILRCHLLGSSLPQVISTPSSIPERHRMDFLSPPPAPSSRFLQFHSWLWFFQRIILFFGGGWHIHPGNRKISECSVKISIVCLFLSLTCMKEIVTLPGISL